MHRRRDAMVCSPTPLYYLSTRSKSGTLVGEHWSCSKCRLDVTSVSALSHDHIAGRGCYKRGKATPSLNFEPGRSTPHPCTGAHGVPVDDLRAAFAACLPSHQHGCRQSGGGGAVCSTLANDTRTTTLCLAFACLLHYREFMPRSFQSPVATAIFFNVIV